MFELPFDVAAFLAEPLRPAQVASVSAKGSPVLGSMWFLYSDRRFWFSSTLEGPIPVAFANGADVAVIVDDYTPPERIRQVRVRGAASVEPHDPKRVEGMYQRYLGSDVEGWPEDFRARLTDPHWALWTVTPTSGLIAGYPNFVDHELRWRRREDNPLP